VTIPVDDTSSDTGIVEWLRSNNVHMEKDPNGDERIFDSSICRRALVQYRRMLHLRMCVIAENIANINTTRDARGEKHPYRRRRVVARNNASVQVESDPSPFLKRYQPAHPDADADGYVLYPNVDRSVEDASSLEASVEYRTVTRILQRFDPTMVLN